MKDLLSKEHYPYKIHILSMKSSAYPPSIADNSPIWTTRLFYKKTGVQTLQKSTEHARFQIERIPAQNHWVASKSTQHFILSRSIN